MFPEYTVVVGFIIGAFIGSFLNVVIYRLPRGLSLVIPPSHCPNCKHRLTIPDLIPLFSYLLYGRKCRHCRNPISSRYFFVELCSATVWGVFWWQNLIVGADPVRFLVLAVFGSALLAALFIDIAYFIIPDSINVLLLLLGLGYNVWLFVSKSDTAFTRVGELTLPSSIVAANAGVLIFWGIAFLGRLIFRKDALGHGDIKLARGIGAVLFLSASLGAYALSIVFGAILGPILLLILRNSRDELQTVEQLANEYVEEPESLGSLLKCGLGYFLWFDVVGLFVPKFEKWWFGEEPILPEEEDDWQPGVTTIPFGPYLALGAIFSALFEHEIISLASRYWHWATGGA